MLAAVIQLCSQDDVSKNLARVVVLIGEAARAGAQLIALPENFAYMGDETGKRAIAEKVDGHGVILSAVMGAAREHGVYVVAGGMPETSEDPERPYNSSVLVDPRGAVVAVYRKLHLFDVDLADGTSLRESDATTAGFDKVVAVVHGATTRAGARVDVPIGMSVCYDVRFPELYRSLERRGARIVTVPAAFTVTTGKDHWHVLLRARAIENQVFVLAPGQQGKHPLGRQTYGKSLIIDPWGDVLAQCGDGEGFAVARLDLQYQDRVRAALPCLAHRRLSTPP
jgi:predicted amidohydrolase